MRFIRRHKLMVVGSFLALALFAVVRAATSEPSLELIVAEVSDDLKERLGLQLTVGHIGVVPGSARAEVAPVVVKDTEGVVLFSADRVVVELAPLKMFARRVQFDDLELVNPRGHLRVTKDGRVLGIKPISLDGAASDDPLFRVDVEDFRVEGGELTVDLVDDGGPDPTSADDVAKKMAYRQGQPVILASAQVKGINTRLKGSGRDGHRLKFSVEQAALVRPSDRIETERFTGRLAVFGDGLLSPERVTLDDIVLRADAGTLNVSGSVLLGRLDQIPALDLDLHGTSELPAVSKHLDLPIFLEGRVAVGAHVQSELGAKGLHYVGQGDVAEMKMDGFVVGTMRGQFVGDKEKMVFSDSTWEIGGSTIDGEGTLKLNEHLDFVYDAVAADVSLYDILAGEKIDGSWVEMLMDGELSGTGRILPDFQVEGTGRGHFHDLVVGNKDARKIRGEDDIVLLAPYDIAAEADFLADLEHLELHGVIDDEITRVNGDVSLFWDADKGFEVFASSQRAGFGSLDNSIANVPFEGTGSFQLQIAGPYVNPLVVAQGSVENFELDGYELADTGTSHLRYLAGQLGFYGVQANKGSSTFSGDVVIDWWQPTKRFVMRDAQDQRLTPPAVVEMEDGMQIAIDMDILEAEIRDLREMIPRRYDSGPLAFFRDLDLDGPIKGTIDAAGYIGDASIDHLEGRLAFAMGKDGQILGQQLDGGMAMLRLVPGVYQLDRLMLEAAGGELRAQEVLVYRDDGEMAGPITARGLELGRLDALADTGKPWVGTARMDVQVSGLAENPVFIGVASLDDAAWGDIPIGSAEVTVLHQNRVVGIKGPMLNGRGRGVFDVGTAEPYSYVASLEVSKGPLGPLLPPDLLPASITAELEGVVEVQGELSSFSQSRGTVALSSLEIGTEPQITLESPGRVLAHFFGDEITIDRLALRSNRDDRIEVGGRCSASDIDLTFSGEGDLWLASALSDQLRSSSGKIAADVSLSGDWSSARMSGRATINRGRFDVAEFEPMVDEVDARISFAGEQVLIDSARGTVGGAPFRGQGTVTLDGTSPQAYDLEVTYEDLQLSIPEWLPTRSSGTVTLTGPASFPTLAGEVELLQASYTDDINWERFMPEFRRRVREPRVFDKEAEDIRFDLHIVSDGGIVVQNNVADIEAKGDLWLVGTEERTGMKGTVSLLHGLVDFRQNRYRLTSGTVEFTETYAITPVLDVEAETTVKDYDITAHVIGPLKNLRIDLSSRPDLAEIDILALLTFGFTQVELQDTTTTAGVAGLEMVTAYTGLEQEVKRILPEAVRESGVLKVDELKLTSQFSTRAQSSVPAVSVGFEVNPGFWGIDGSKLRLSSTIVDTGGGGTDQRIEWEKRFDNNLRLRLTWNSQDQGACPQCNNQWGDVGGDIWYRLEF